MTKDYCLQWTVSKVFIVSDLRWFRQNSDQKQRNRNEIRSSINFINDNFSHVMQRGAKIK